MQQNIKDTMKKILLTVLCIIFAISLIACGDEPCEHTYDNDCDTQCNACQEERQITHSWTSATCLAPKTCSICSLTEGTVLEHTPTADDGDCTSDIKCSACSTVLVKGNSTHSPNSDDGDCTTAIKCKNCSVITTPAKTEHEMSTEWTATDSGHYFKCKNCDIKNSEGEHAYEITYEWNARFTTCTANGICSSCKKEIGEYATATYKDGVASVSFVSKKFEAQSKNVFITSKHTETELSDLIKNAISGGATDITVLTPAEAEVSLFQKIRDAIALGEVKVNLTVLGAKKIPEGAFRNDFEKVLYIKSLSLPSATEIGDDAVRMFIDLESVYLPKVEKIGDGAFLGCKNLKSLDLSALEELGIYAFSGCYALEEIKSLGTVTEIPDSAFYSCKNLKEVSSEFVTVVSNYAFSYCDALESVNFPNLKEIRSSAFAECVALHTITLEKVTSIGDDSFFEATSLVEVNLPLVTDIPFRAFDECLSLKKIYLPLATSIGEVAFYKCTALEEIYAPLVRSVGRGAFLFCGSVKHLSLPSLTFTENQAIWFSSLETLTLTAEGDLNIYDGIRAGDFENTVLTLNADKKDDVDGNTWLGITFKEIKFEE